MVATYSTMNELGTAAPNFVLPDTTKLEKFVDLEDAVGKPLLLMFICNHCPFVIHIAERLAQIGNRAQIDGYAVYAVSANDIRNYPQDGPDQMALFAQRYKFEFPYLFDESQQVAKAYQAACTPDFFVYDHEHKLRYRGQMDGSRPGNAIPVDGAELTSALAAVLNRQPVNPEQTPSIGCNIKWRQGNQPDYF